MAILLDTPGVIKDIIFHVHTVEIWDYCINLCLDNQKRAPQTPSREVSLKLVGDKKTQFVEYEITGGRFCVILNDQCRMAIFPTIFLTKMPNPI